MALYINFSLPSNGLNRCNNERISCQSQYSYFDILSCNLFFSEFCWGKAMVAYTMPQQRKKEESERLRGERDQVKFIDL